MNWQVVVLILGLVGEIVLFLSVSMCSGAYERVRKHNET